MKPDISEFSYGFAIVDDLVNCRRLGISAAPVFPSLYEEGQTAGGYDVRLDKPGVPLFLQFKLGNRMVRRSAMECRRGLLNIPFYRMKLRPAKFSSQHASLLDLEAAGNDVYYVAPVFSQPGEFNQYYFAREVLDHSILLCPSVIGPLPDDGPHHVAYADSVTAYFCSDPEKIEGPIGFEAFGHTIRDRLEQTTVSFGQRISSIAESMFEIAVRRAHERRGWEEVDLSLVREVSDPLKRAAFLSRHFFDCEMLIVHQGR